jgi:undecaprenyl-diphosphatase
MVLAGLCLFAFLVEASLLGHLQWYDANVAGFFAALRGCDVSVGVATVSNAAAWVSPLFLVVALGIAVRRRTPGRDVAWTASMLAAGLLLAQALKVVLERGRPWVPAWASAGDSFPSGHVMNAALFVGAALSLLPPRASGRDPARIAVGTGGTLFIWIVLFTRLYLGRHWLSDVTGSLLLSLAVVGLMGVGRTFPRVVVLATAAALLVALFLTAASGGRIALPSPSSPSADPAFNVVLRWPSPRAKAGIEGTWVESRRDGQPGYLRVSSPEVRLVASMPRYERALLRIAARPLRGLRASRCAEIMLFVDGAPVGELPFSRKWRSYTFALPPLAAGPHDVRLRVWPHDAGGTDVPMLALRGLQVELLG